LKKSLKPCERRFGKDETTKMIQKKGRWLHRKPIHFEVRIVSCGVFPELDRNPWNFFAQMTEDEREDEFVEILGHLWPETIRGGSKAPAEPAKDPLDYKLQMHR